MYVCIRAETIYQYINIILQYSNLQYEAIILPPELEKIAEFAFEYLQRGKELLEQIQPIQLSLLDKRTKTKRLRKKLLT